MELASPALTLAHSLHDRGMPLSEILVPEKESEDGGLCRSEMMNGSSIDPEGGHFLDIKHRDVLDFVFRFAPESERNRHQRVLKIHLHYQMVDYPLEANWPITSWISSVLLPPER